jgi:CIC family chloride channel protein
MAAVFAAAGRAPITAVLIVFELTGDYSIILPLMLAVVVATGLSKLLGEDSIYTLKLHRRGIDIERPAPPTGVLGGIKVATAMRQGPIAVRAEATAADVAGRLAAEGRDALPVVGPEERVIGIVDARALERALADGGEAAVGDLVEDPPPLRADDDLGRAVIWLAEGDRSALPVLAADGGLAGWLEHRDILRAYADANSLRSVNGGGKTN